MCDKRFQSTAGIDSHRRVSPSTGRKEDGRRVTGQPRPRRHRLKRVAGGTIQPLPANRRTRGWRLPHVSRVAASRGSLLYRGLIGCQVAELTRGAGRMRAGGVAPESRPPSRLLQALQLLPPFACPWSFGALHAQRDFGDDAAFSQEAVGSGDAPREFWQCSGQGCLPETQGSLPASPVFALSGEWGVDLLSPPPASRDNRSC